MKPAFSFCVLVTILLQSRVLADDAKIYEWGLLTNEVQMSISVANGSNEIKIGQPVKLLMQIRNNSTNVFRGRYSLGGWRGDGLSFNIIDPSNADISPNYLDQKDAFAVVTIAIQPNQTKSLNIFNLSMRCQFDKVGTYKIIAMQRGDLGMNLPPFTIISNPLSIAVVDP